MRGAEPIELRSKEAALSLLRRGVSTLKTLGRYHNMDASSASTLLTLVLRRRAPAGGSGFGGEVLISSLTLIGLGGTERLAKDRAKMHLTEGAARHRTVTQFADLVEALSKRSTAAPESTPWLVRSPRPRGTRWPTPVHVAHARPRAHQVGKLSRLTRERLGGNARVGVLASVKSGDAAASLATLSLAAKMRTVSNYPLVNVPAVAATLSIRRSEVHILRDAIAAMQASGQPSNLNLPAAPSAEYTRGASGVSPEMLRGRSRLPPAHFCGAPRPSHSAGSAPLLGPPATDTVRHVAASGGDRRQMGSRRRVRMRRGAARASRGQSSSAS